MKNKLTSRYFKLGLLVLISIFLLYFGLNFLKGIDIFSSESSYYVLFDKVDGLQKNAPINLKGYKVGQISDIKYEPNNPHPFIIVIAISKKTQLPKSSKIELYEDGLLGTKTLRVVLDEKDIASSNFYQSGDTIPSFVTGGFMSTITNDLVVKISQVAEQADSLIRSLREITESAELKSSLSSLEKTAANLASSSLQLKTAMNNDVPKLLSNANTITSDFKEVSGKLKNINFQATVDSINTTISNLNFITQQINSKDGSLGLLMNDKQLYLNLQDATSNANNLLLDLKENPKRYVHFSIFGGKK